MPGEGYRFDGLAKSPLSGQGFTMAVPSSGNDELPREGALSDAPPERREEEDVLEADAKQVSQAAIDQTKSLAPKPGGLVLIGANRRHPSLSGGERLVCSREQRPKAD